MQLVEFLESNKRTGDFVTCDLILSFTIIFINDILLFTCFKNQSEFAVVFTVLSCQNEEILLL